MLGIVQARRGHLTHLDIWAKVKNDKNKDLAGEVMHLVRYIIIPQKRGMSQRVTLPMELLKEKKWLKTDCYMVIDRGADFITITPYSTAIKTKDKQKREWA